MFKLDPRFEKQITAAFKQSVKVVEEQAHTEVKSPKWSHPRQTKRKNGDIVSSPRDIVDSGELDRSLYSEVQGISGEVGAKADYAALVHEGYTTTGGNDVPSKPFLKTAFTEADRLGLIQQAFDDELT